MNAQSLDPRIAKILRGDISVFTAHTQLSPEDKRSLLAVHAAIRRVGKPFTYLEIGSNLGGSLQTFLADDLCTAVYSIDKRPTVTPDERGPYDYCGNTTAKMIDELSRDYREHLPKLKCFDADVSELDASLIDSPPTLCFIDGEHTDAAAIRDFRFCLDVAARPAVILFHDIHIVFRGLEQCHQLLTHEGIPFYAYNLPNFVGVMEIGKIGLIRDEAVFERVAVSQLALIEHLKEMAGYRDFVAKLNRNHVYVAARKTRNWLRDHFGAGAAASRKAVPPGPVAESLDRDR